MKDIPDLLLKYESGDEIIISFQYSSDEMIMMINSLVAKILIKTDRVFLIDTVMSIIKEIILNSIKANAKRTYFEKANLDITNTEDYSLGMSKFMRCVMSNSEVTKNYLERSSHEIVIKIKNVDDDLKIIFINNSTLLPIEIERIQARIRKAADFEKFSDAYDFFFDPIEGAGLGIVLIIFLLKKAGIGSENLKIEQGNEFYTTTLIIPANPREIETTSIIKKDIIKEVNSLPTFPEYIIELKELCNSKNAAIGLIASKITRDPSLTADILKIANSAGFNIGKKIETIEKAIILIGLNNIDSILSIAISRKIIDNRYKKFEEIWGHCNRIAFYSRIIAEKIGLTSITENVFISGLLHDIGKIVLLSLDIDLVNRISHLINEMKYRSSTILEEISLGISHSTIGSLIAEKWNFPEYLIQVIKHHHSPLKSDPEYRDHVSIIYLANMLLGIETGKYLTAFLNTEILEKFEIYNKDDLENFSEELNEKYNLHNSSISITESDK